MGIKNMSQQEHSDSISNGVMKKIILMSSLFLLLGFAPHVLAQGGFVPLAPIPGLTEGVAADEAGLANFFNNLYKYLIGLAATLAVIEIIWGGLQISTQDSVSKQGEGKERIQEAIFGLVLVLSPVLVFSIINPSILNLSLNLPPIDTTVAPTPSGTTLAGPTPDSATDIIQSNQKYTDRFYKCLDTRCDGAKKSCSNDPQAKYQIEKYMSVVCFKDGSIDPKGRTWFSLVPFTDYTCDGGGVPHIKCIMK